MQHTSLDSHSLLEVLQRGQPGWDGLAMFAAESDDSFGCLASVGDLGGLEGSTLDLRHRDLLPTRGRSRRMQGKLLIRPDLRLDPLPLPHIPETGSLILAPGLADQQMVGAFLAYRRAAGTWSQRRRRDVELAAFAVAQLLERQRQHALTTRHKREAQILIQASGLFNTTLDFDEVLRRVMAMATDVLGDTCSVFLIDEEADQMRYITHHPDPATLQRVKSVFDALPVTGDSGVASLVLRSRQPVLIQDTATAELPDHVRVYIDSLNMRSCLSVPLIDKGRLLGVLTSAVISSNRALDEAALSIAVGLGQQAAIAIANAQLFRELQRAQCDLRDKAERLQRALTRTVAAEEAERRRIAEDLHDSVTQLALGAMFQVHHVKQQLDGDPGQAGQRLTLAGELIEQTIVEMRDAIFDLHPAVLHEFGLVPALRAYSESWEQRCGVACELHVRGTPYRLAEAVELSIYRIVQEALHNIEKHARARRAEISLSFWSSGAKVLIHDDGQGLQPESLRDHSGGHLGSLTMRERAESVGGKLHVASSDRGGCELVVDVPRR